LKNGYYYTGDIGKIDEDGYIYYVGRTKDIIKVRGFRISSKEVEDALLEINEIHEVAVIGVDDSILGEAIKAFIVLRDNAELTKENIRDALKAKLPPYKHPSHIKFVPSIPKNKSGKVLKLKLKKQHKLQK
jgi:acyl-coenzyme A synthetase/AMP-(fatty) acid ligase